MKDDVFRYILSSSLLVLAVLSGFFAMPFVYLIGFITALWVMIA